MDETKTYFELALEKLQAAGAEVNSAYYTDGLDKKFPIVHPSDPEDSGLRLWNLVKKAESIASETLEEFEILEENLENKE